MRTIHIFIFYPTIEKNNNPHYAHFTELVHASEGLTRLAESREEQLQEIEERGRRGVVGQTVSVMYR